MQDEQDKGIQSKAIFAAVKICQGLRLALNPKAHSV